MKRIITVALVILFLIGLAGNSFAENNPEDDDWHFMVAPLFIWGLSIDGTQEIGPTATSLELNFKDDILENLAGVFTLHFEARKNDLKIFAEYQYSTLDPTVDTPVGFTADIDFNDQLGEIGVAYKVATMSINDIEILGGARYTRQDVKVKLNPGPQLVDVTEHWWDGFLGLRIFTHISESWTFIGRGDIGAGGSDFIWNLSALFDYQFKNWGSVFFGYKWMDYDYESGSGLDRYGYDAFEQGPVGGLAFYW